MLKEEFFDDLLLLLFYTLKVERKKNYSVENIYRSTFTTHWKYNLDQAITVIDNG